MKRMCLVYSKHYATCTHQQTVVEPELQYINIYLSLLKEGAAEVLCQTCIRPAGQSRGLRLTILQFLGYFVQVGEEQSI